MEAFFAVPEDAQLSTEVSSKAEDVQQREQETHSSCSKKVSGPQENEILVHDTGRSSTFRKR